MKAAVSLTNAADSPASDVLMSTTVDVEIAAQLSGTHAVNKWD